MIVAVIVGVAVEHDAISSAALEQVDALKSLPEVDEVHLFTQWTDRPHRCPTHVTGNPWEMLRHPDFRRCDVAIFHWGIRFALFDAITLLGQPGMPTPVVHFHNCTPPSLVEPAHRDNIVRSIDQLHHVIELGVRFWTYSEFNRRTLIDWGATESCIDWVTFPVPTVDPDRAPRRVGGVNILSVGRLVPAKGAHVLIAALSRLRPTTFDRVRATIVSSSTFSSDEYGDEIRDLLARDGGRLGGMIRLLSSPSDAELRNLYLDATILVSTSFHEGLCVPVIEAYAAGCRVIGTTAGNLPYIAIPPDPLVPPGDPDALAMAIEQVVNDVEIDEPAYDRRRRALIESFSERASAAMLQSALVRLTHGRGLVA